LGETKHPLPSFEHISDIRRSSTDLLVENALLRQQLIVLRRQIKRPQLTNGDRIRLVLLARFSKYWHQAIQIIQPDTLLRWHRHFFRLYWRHVSRNRRKKQEISSETIQLLRQMVRDSQLWGAEPPKTQGAGGSVVNS
jgi:putative transposase